MLYKYSFNHNLFSKIFSFDIIINFVLDSLQSLCSPLPYNLSGQRRPSKFQKSCLGDVLYILSSLLNSLINILSTDLMQARHCRPSTSGTSDFLYLYKIAIEINMIKSSMRLSRSWDDGLAGTRLPSSNFNSWDNGESCCGGTQQTVPSPPRRAAMVSQCLVVIFKGVA